jgi:pantoate--beta-alanine ligase
MKVFNHINSLRAWLKNKKRLGKTIGFVPTMGALHCAHGSLIQRSQKRCDITVVSIFVNPLQFGPQEDFNEYPRMMNADLQFLKKEKVDIVFTPSYAEMYPNGFSTLIHISGPIVHGLCAPFRPNHFNGVATVVLKLLHIVHPTHLFLGQKDAQQVAVIKKILQDLNWNTQVVVCPTLREADGLALSSRNKRLSASSRKFASKLFESLYCGKKCAQSGEKNVLTVLNLIRDKIRQEPRIHIQYLEVVHKDTLQPLQKIQPQKTMIAIAATIDNVRLIDNIIV